MSFNTEPRTILCLFLQYSLLTCTTHIQTHSDDAYCAQPNLKYISDDHGSFKVSDPHPAIPTASWRVNTQLEHEILHANFGKFLTWENSLWSVAKVKGGLKPHELVTYNQIPLYLESQPANQLIYYMCCDTGSTQRFTLLSIVIRTAPESLRIWDHKQLYQFF